MSRTAYTLLLGTALALASCRSETSEAQHDAGTPPHDTQVESHGAETPHGEEGHPGHGDVAVHEALPLRPIMQQLGVAMAGFTQAMWLEEYEAMEAYAEDIAGHPHLSDEELQRIRAELGQEMEDFIAVDEAVHDASVRLHAAAEARDMDGVLQQLGEVQAGCMSCHTRFRERLRTDQPTP